MVTRRKMIQSGAALAAASLIGERQTLARAARTLLILGGTGFIGPHLTHEALRRGWKVTHFNRGKHNADVAPGVETLIGDRAGQLDALRGRRWDAVIDDTGYIPKFVKQSAELLAPLTEYCLFISSISAYASFAKPNDESSATALLANPDDEIVTDDTYGPMKALCERYTQDAFGSRACIVRPGYIVGPLDPTDRFTYWPVSAARGGEMLAPGTPRDPIQIIDVRDLAVWLMRLVAARTSGVFNAVSPVGAFTMGELISACQHAAPRAGTRVTWVPEEFLLQHWTAAQVDLPPWSPMQGDTAANSLTSGARARKAGLRTRSLRHTVADTLAWFKSLPAERQAKQHLLIEPAREAETLKSWYASSRPAAQQP
jgi:2'-hydroxyisoflavone reductase